MISYIFGRSFTAFACSLAWLVPLLLSLSFAAYVPVANAQMENNDGTTQPISISEPELVGVTEESFFLEYTVNNETNSVVEMHVVTQLRQSADSGLVTADADLSHEIVSVPAGDTVMVETTHSIRSLTGGDYLPTVMLYDAAGQLVAEASFGYIELPGGLDTVELVADTCFLESGREQYSLDAGESFTPGEEIIMICEVKNHADFARTIFLETVTEAVGTGAGVETATADQDLFLEAGEEQTVTFYVTTPEEPGQYMTLVSLKDADDFAVANRMPVQYGVTPAPAAQPTLTDTETTGVDEQVYLLLVLLGGLVLMVGLLFVLFKNRHGSRIQSLFIFAFILAGSLFAGQATVYATTADSWLTGTGCAISAGSNTCDGTFSWEIIGASSPNLYNRTTRTTYTTDPSGEDVSFPLEKTSEDSPVLVRTRDGSTTLRNLFVNPVCASGTTWDEDDEVCVDSGPPSATLSGAGCTITAGNSTCNATFTWNIENAAAPNLYNVTREVQYSTNASGDARPFVISHGSNRVDARDGENFLESVQVEATCAEDAPWNGTVCGEADAPEGSIGATSCIVPIGASSCESSVSWRALNFVGDVSVRQGSEQFSTSPISGATIREVSPSNRTFSLVDTGSTFSRITHAMVDCSPGSAWNGAVCEPTSEPAMPDCSLLEQPDRYVLEVPYPWLYADRDASWAQRVLEYDLPAGRYNVSAFAWDGYNGREGSVQPQEQFKVEFYRGAAKIAETAATPDLPDRQREASWEGEIASDLALGQNTTQIRLQHTAYPSSNPNSVAAVCVAFDCVEEGCPEVFDVTRENYPVCPFVPQEDRLIVHFDQPRSSSDTNPAMLFRLRETCGSGSSCRRVSTDKVAILPPASYRVTAFSWDGYPGRAGSIQDERWKIQLFQNEALLAETDPTEDVDDSVDYATWTGVIADELVVPSMANTVRAENVGGGSVLSICTAFDCLEPGCLDIDEPKVEVVASKIVCTDPDQMPRFSNTGETIESDTAQRWVTENDSCDFADGWQFQRAINSTPSGTTDNAGLLFGWNTFGPTVGGAATTSIFLAEFEDPENDRILVREAWQPGYAPFAGYSGSSDSDSVSAEMYCHDDVIGFDNHEAINGVEAGETYHCVAWNYPESGTLGLTGTDCEITRAGHDTCTSYFTWNIQDATSPNLYNSSMGEQYTGSAFGDGHAFQIQHGENVVQLRDGTEVEEHITVTASCGSSLEWDSDIGACVDPDGPWASIQASGCTIVAGESTCQSTISWQSGNTTEGKRSVRHYYPEGGSSHISGQPEGEATRSLRFGQNGFQFLNEGKRIARTRVAAACGAELNWDGSACQPEIPDCPEGTWWDGEDCAEPELNLELASSVIRQGETTQVRWGITNISSIDVDFTCTLRGAGLDEGFSDITEDREISRNIEGESPLTTPPVMSAFDIRLQCTETGSNEVFSATERLEVVPAPREN